MTIDPANLTAQLQHRSAGNPPSTLPDSAISNCFPGLEFDFRNVWRRMFAGIELHEADNYVLSGEGDLAHLAGQRLLCVNGAPTVVRVFGPQTPGGGASLLTSAGNPDGVWTMEWSNALVGVLRENVGKAVTCHFTKLPPPKRAELPVRIPDDLSTLEAVDLTVTPLFATSEAGNPLAVIDEARVEPGELTMSLCSPWQNDYRECACYYWASTRPDYVNVEVDESGTTAGDMWLAKYREPKRYVLDNRTDSRLLSYDDLFQAWQEHLKFIVSGRDHE